MATMARFYAAKGDYDMANREVQLTKTRIEQNGSSDYRNYDLARAFVALEKGDSAEFAAIWKVHAKSRFLGSDYLMAISYYGSGRIGEAVQLLESAMNYYGDNRANWPATSVKLHYWLGKCYEASGWNTKAIDEYETFLNIWKDADEGIAEVKDARERLTRLKSNS
jgi:tetratricopeptide (TPR) repeat protein